MARILAIYLMPPFAIGRLGPSPTPLDAFDWAEDPATHGAGQTIIRPAVSLRIRPDGSIGPTLPQAIQFRDGPDGLIRPTAPFFEVWARFDDSPGGEPEPLTASRLELLGGSLGRVSYRVTAANLKAARRTKDVACGFGAEILLKANDHVPRPLLATSPNVAGSRPLVRAAAPIGLGRVQAVRPYPGTALGVDLDVLRLRFTPAAGEVYGPPAADRAPDPAARPGSVQQFEIVPERNRILDPDASWSRFRPSDDLEQPQPADTFDGVEDRPDGLGGQSWGVVDDSCDVVIRAVVEVGPDRFEAIARATAGPPDFAPDRRPIVSLADDLADRDLPPLGPAEVADPATAAEVADLMRRVFETASLTNLDALRHMMLNRQVPAEPDQVPRTDGRSMTSADAPLADQVPAILGEGGTDAGLGYTQVARDAHGALADVDNMLALFRGQPERVRHLLRPPYAKVADLPQDPPEAMPTDALGPASTPVLKPRDRDPRVARDQLHDMRMPPYMRDADATPLSLTWRQYREVIALIDHLAGLDAVAMRAISPVMRHVAQVAERRRLAADAAELRGERS